jgi:uncharacterized repeat protein (TIGR01451 family)
VIARKQHHKNTSQRTPLESVAMSRTRKTLRKRIDAARPRLEPLEQRMLLSTVFVTNTDDGNTGSLRNAILLANALTSGIDTIDFAITGTGIHTIAPQSALPTITKPITINGYSQPGASPNTLAVGDNAVLTIVLDGISAGNTPIGLTITAANTTVRGLVISRFNGEEIDLSGPGSDTIAGNFLGTDAAGTTGLGGGGNSAAIVVSGPNQTIGGLATADRNIVAASGYRGIQLTGGTGARILNNYIGTDKTGAAALGGSGDAAVYISGATGVTLGGSTAAERNVISGNRTDAVVVQTSGNVIEGNDIGTTAAGNAALQNGGNGVVLNNGGSTIGGTAPGAGNLISGNALAGINIHFSGTSISGNMVLGNLIGTDATGKFKIPNQGAGVDIGNGGGGGFNNTIGGLTPGARNVISGNVVNGINSSGTGSANVIVGNYIGVDVTGLAPLSNGGEGVDAYGSSNITIGGTAAGAGNVISANALDGVFIFSTGVVVQGNLIGLGSDGLTPLGNGVAGVITYYDTLIGGTTSAARNIISANGSSGIVLNGGSGKALVQGNFIGSDGSGLLPRGNFGPGVFVNVSGNTIGGADAGAGNVIAANGASNVVDGYGVIPGGIRIAGTSGNLIQGNLIGVGVDGSTALGNRGSGIFVVSEATNNIIRRNTIAFNAANNSFRGAGIEIIDGSVANVIDANSIFSNTGLGIDLGNDGVTMNTAGSPHSGPNNLQGFPVLSSVSTTSMDTVVTGSLTSNPNTIFTVQFFANAAADPSGFGEGQTFLGEIRDLTTNGDGFANFAASLRTVIAPGQFVSATATDPAGNTSEFSGSAMLPAANPLVVTTTADDGPGSLRDAITFANSNPGIHTIDFAIPGAGAHTIAPLSPLPDVTAPVVIDGTSQSGYTGTPIVELDGVNAGFANGLTLLGGGITVKGLAIDRFQFSGFGGTGNGILIGGYGLDSPTPGGDTIQGNYIGLGTDGVTPLGNGAAGVNVTDSSNNVIGGATSGTGNVIAANASDGIIIEAYRDPGSPSGNSVVGNLIGTNAAGTAKLGNLGQGVEVTDSVNTTVGGTTGAAGNVIAASGGNGIEIQDRPGLNTLIQNNFIGTDRTASVNLGNNFAGIAATGSNFGTAAGNTIGGATPGLGNVIAFNFNGGVDIQGGSGLPILGNSIFSNTNGNGGISYRQGTDPVVFPPVLTSAIGASSGGVTIQGTFAGLSGEIVRLEFFSNDVQFQQQGKVFLGSTNLTADQTGNASFAVTLPVVLSGTQYITATATGGIETTSRFGNEVVFTAVAVPVPADLSVVGAISPDLAVAGNSLTYTFTVSNKGPGTATDVALVDTLPVGVSFGPFTTSQGTAGLDGNLFTAMIGVLASGATATVKISVTPTMSEALTDTAVVKGSEPDPISANNTAVLQTTVASAPADPLVVTTTLDDGPGSLRAAITYANVHPGLDTITFDIPIAGIQVITPLSALPAITAPVIIDGTSQPGSKVNDLAQGNDAKPLIEIDGEDVAGSVPGLEISAGGSTVRGLVIHGFAVGAGIRLDGKGGDTIAGNFLGINFGGDGQTFVASVAKGNRVGIQVETPENTIGGTLPADRNVVSANTFAEVYLTGVGATANLVEDNYVGTTPDGTASLSNSSGGDGVDIDNGAPSNTVGGISAGARNLISGNGRSGVRIAEAGSNTNVVEGNFIGTDVTGTKPLGNAFHGVLIQRGALGNVIGGTVPGTGNVIAANSLQGVAVADASTSGNVIEGNFIGTDLTGTSHLGNADQGVSIAFNAFNNTVGGTVSGAGNTIAFNAMNGVTVEVGNGAGNAILDNAIFGNQLLGIDLGNDGPTANTPGGPHTGPNDLQNTPIITSADVREEHVILGGTLNSIPRTTFLLEFFMVAVIDASGHGQGQVRLGTAMVTTNADGNALFSADVADFGGSYTATATDPNGNTSEFAPVYTPAVPVPNADLAVTGTVSPAIANVGGNVTYTFTVIDNGPDPATNVILTDALPKGATFVSASSSEGKADRSGDVVTAKLGSLANGATATVTIVVTLAAAGTSLDSATVTADQTDTNTKNNRADVSVSATLASPAMLTAALDGAAINLRWTAVPGAIGYNIYRSTTSGAETLYRTGVVGAASFRDDAVEAGQTYDYQVTAVAGPIESARSNEATATVPPPVLVAPIRVYASLLDTGGGTFAPFITWGYANSSTVIRFHVFRSTNSAAEVEITDSAGVSAHNFVDRTANAATTYTYRITATFNGMRSTESVAATITVPPKSKFSAINLKRAVGTKLTAKASAVPRGPLHAQTRHRAPKHHT